ncbi:MAG: hypothetical protein ISS88_00535 [Candidatus Portnoybacteria bacterium]|nr:hypothetical protein [Candidatus Portnoybacteria bacterium]
MGFEQLKTEEELQDEKAEKVEDSKGIEKIEEEKEEKHEEVGLVEKKQEKEKIEEVRAELQGIESKEAEPKISIEERINELKKQEEELSEEVKKAWEEYIAKGPSLKTLKGWTEIITQEEHNRRSAKYDDAIGKMHAITGKRREMEKRISTQSYLEDARTAQLQERKYSFQPDTQKEMQELLDIDSVPEFLESMDATTLEKSREKLKLDDAESFEVERAEKIREASKEISHQFEEQDITKGTKVKLDNGEEGWVRRFDREEGILELWNNSAFTKLSSYDIRDIKEVQKTEESKLEKARKKVRTIY